MHSKLPGSFEVNENDADVAFVCAAGSGGVSDVVGSVTSTVQVREAGLPSALPAGSTALTWKVCSPSLRPERLCGLVQAAKAPPSSLHSKVPDSLDVKAKFADVELTLPLGPVIDVSGAVPSTVTVGCELVIVNGSGPKSSVVQTCAPSLVGASAEKLTVSVPPGQSPLPSGGASTFTLPRASTTASGSQASEAHVAAADVLAVIPSGLTVNPVGIEISARLAVESEVPALSRVTV